ncbi:unnamed protein product, partial [marine sediment metagenome]
RYEYTGSLFWAEKRKNAKYQNAHTKKDDKQEKESAYDVGPHFHSFSLFLSAPKVSFVPRLAELPPGDILQNLKIGPYDPI